MKQAVWPPHCQGGQPWSVGGARSDSSEHGPVTLPSLLSGILSLHSLSIWPSLLLSA